MKRIRPTLRYILCPYIPDLQSYRPEDFEDFSIFLQAIFGPYGEPGEESFQIAVCSPKWLMKELDKSGILMGRHYLFMKIYNYDKLLKFLEKYASRISGESWDEVAEKLSRLGLWEFEDYRPYDENQFR